MRKTTKESADMLAEWFFVKRKKKNFRVLRSHFRQAVGKKRMRDVWVAEVAEIALEDHGLVVLEIEDVLVIMDSDVLVNYELFKLKY